MTDRAMENETGEPIGTEEFGAFVDGVDYPMYVVTVASKGARGGCLVGFASQVSIDPPRLLVCISVRNHTYALAREASVLAAHALAPGQLELARIFGEETGDEVDKFEQWPWRPGPGGVPLLEDCPRHVVGRVVRQVPFGDHTGFVLEPIEADASSNGPVLMFSDVQDLTPGHGA